MQNAIDEGRDAERARVVEILLSMRRVTVQPNHTNPLPSSFHRQASDVVADAIYCERVTVIEEALRRVLGEHGLQNILDSRA